VVAYALRRIKHIDDGRMMRCVSLGPETPPLIPYYNISERRAPYLADERGAAYKTTAPRMRHAI
jgi:hypothetical protein